MDLKDMILVTENDRGTETNMLMTLDDYKSFIASHLRTARNWKKSWLGSVN